MPYFEAAQRSQRTGELARGGAEFNTSHQDPVERLRSSHLPVTAATIVLVLAAALPAVAQTRTVEGHAEQPWWRQAVFYEIFVRSFADSDGDGDGDLQGLISRLDYLNDGDPATTDDLGVSGIWLMPIMQSPSYHGYDVIDYTTVEKDYGSNADLQELTAAAHRRGMRVIIDLVLNHTSSRHPWFRDAVRADSPYHDWYLWASESHSYLGPWGQPVWHQLPWWQRGWRHFNCLAYYGIFSAGMPDLNHENQEVWQAVSEVSRFWLDEMGVDGFRLDAVRHLIEDGVVQENTPATHRWLARYHTFCRSVAPATLLVGEVWTDAETVATYGPDEVDLAFQFDLAAAMLQALRSRDRMPLAEAQRALTTLYPDHGYASFLSNHDQNRVMWHLDGDFGRAKLAATLLLTGPGVPFLYYGEEIGMTGRKPDPDLRTPMQWSAEPHAGFSTGRPWRKPKVDYPRVNVAVQLSDDDSLLATYRRLVQLRNQYPALQTGDLVVLETSSQQVHAYLRRSPLETILVIVNLGEEEVANLTLPPGDWIEGLDLAHAVELLHGATISGRTAPDGGLQPLATLPGETAYLIRVPRSTEHA